MLTFATPYKKGASQEVFWKFIEKTVFTVQEASTEKKQFIEKR